MFTRTIKVETYLVVLDDKGLPKEKVIDVVIIMLDKWKTGNLIFDTIHMN